MGYLYDVAFIKKIGGFMDCIRDNMIAAEMIPIRLLLSVALVAVITFFAYMGFLQTQSVISWILLRMI